MTPVYTLRRSFLAFFLLFPLFSSLIPQNSAAQYRFDEGDWIAWADTREVNGFGIGKNTIYVATGGGVLRWDRIAKQWMLPWYSVPGPLDATYFLNNVTSVYEDPSTLDVYFKKGNGWVVRDYANLRWRPVDQLPDMNQYNYEAETSKLIETPDRSIIPPHGYFLNEDGGLDYRLTEWAFVGGISDNMGTSIVGWNKLGVGVYSEFDPVVQLYPGGPGPASVLDVNDSSVWCASNLDLNSRWVWQRDRSEDRWSYHHPGLEWGLTESKLHALRIGKNGTVWIASSEGVQFYSNDNWHRLEKSDGLPRQRVYDVEPIGDGAWAATELGLAFIHEMPREVQPLDRRTRSKQATYAFSVLTSHQDTLFAAGPGILLSYSPNGVWQELKLPFHTAVASQPKAIYKDNKVLALGDDDGFSWKMGNGEWLFAPATLWHHGSVLSIDFHGGYFWLGTDSGLVKFDPTYKDAVVYTSEEGLPGSIVFEVFGEGDWLWLGTDVALVRFLWNAPGRLD